MRNRIRKKQGTTLVELIVCMLLVSIMMVMVVGVVSPAFRIFIRMQKQQYAQMIVDNIIWELQGQVRDAAGYVKIYGDVKYDGTEESGILSGAVATQNPMGGEEKGNALEFVNEEGYVVLVTAGGCPEMVLYRGTTKTDETVEKISPGRLAYRYYWQQSDNNGKSFYYYKEQETGGGGADHYSGRGMAAAFADKYYMGNYLKIEFAFPNKSGTSDTIAKGEKTPYLELSVFLYSDSDMTKLVAQDSAILPLRYEPKRSDEKTGMRHTLSGINP